MEEIGLDIAKHRPMTFEELEDWEGLNFDLIVTLTPEAHHKALELTRRVAAEVEYWPTPVPPSRGATAKHRSNAFRPVGARFLAPSKGPSPLPHPAKDRRKPRYRTS